MWPQLEPLLGKVAKPARYIGLEDGAQRPDHSPDTSGLAPGRTRTPTRSACPTRACRSCTRSSTSGPMRWRSAPTPPGETSRSCCAPAACRCSRVDTHRPAADFDVLALQPVGRAHVHEPARTCVDLAGVPVRAARPPPRAPARGRRRPLHVQPRAHRRLRRLRRPRRRRGDRQRDHRGHRRVEGAAGAPRAAVSTCCASSSHISGVYVPSMYDVRPTTAAFLRGHHAALPRRARAGRQAHRRRSRRLARTPSTSSCRSSRSCTTGSTSRSSAAAPAGAASARRA